MSTLKYWLLLTSRSGMDAVSAWNVLEYFGTPERAYYAGGEDYAPVPMRPAARKGLQDKRMSEPERILEVCHRLGIRILTIQDGEYPQRLKQIADPPVLLYVRGRMLHFDEEVAIGVVGAREPSAYGKKYAEQFGMELAAGGALLISGIAQGLDSCAIRGALQGGGPVVSVLAGGVDVIYPKVNRFLYEDVMAAGALISEYPPGTPHKGEHFPVRNRIISGLSLGVLAVECRRYSGTMSTINHAVEQDRNVYAIPGSLDAEMSEGTNWLIRQGATLVTCGQDILEEYEAQYPLKLKGRDRLSKEAVSARMESLEQMRPAQTAKQKPTQPTLVQQETETPNSGREVVPCSEQKKRFTDDALAVLAQLGKGTCSVDELVERTQIPTRRVLSTLTLLQIEGVVEEKAGKRFTALVELEE